MGGEGYMLDMTRRLQEGRDSSRLRRERMNEKQGRLKKTNVPYPMPDATPEEMGRILHQSSERKDKEEKYFVWATLLIFVVLALFAAAIWMLFLR